MSPLIINVKNIFRLFAQLAILAFALNTLPVSAQSYNQIKRLDPFYRSLSNVTQNKFRPGTPDYYVVQPGDTYHSIARKFLVNPNAWASSWQMPPGVAVTQNGRLEAGSVVVLSKTNAAKLRWIPQGEKALAKRYGGYYGVRTGYNNIKLLPVAWGVGNIKSQVLPPNLIEPFKVQASVVPYTDIANAPLVAGFSDSRLLGYPGKDIFIRGNIDESIKEWYVYRPSEELFDPETYSSLGYVSRLQAIIQPIRRAPDAYTFKVISGNAEIERGARLIPVVKDNTYKEYSYQRPASNILARIVGVYDGVTLTHQFRTIIINRGNSDGVRRGDIFNLLSYTPISYQKEIPMIDIPIVGYGRVYIYRVNENTAFGHVLEGESEVKLYDYVRPDSYDSGGGRANSNSNSGSNVATKPRINNNRRVLPRYSTQQSYQPTNRQSYNTQPFYPPVNNAYPQYRISR